MFQMYPKQLGTTSLLHIPIFLFFRLGLPVLSKVPDGFSPLLYLYGQGINRFPLLVQFIHPFDWVVTTPSNDKNSEEGTVQAGEYARGDTATFFVYTDRGHVDNISDQKKDFFEEVLIKAISQKGNNIYQNFKITNLEPIRGEYKNQEYVIVDFNYELLTVCRILRTFHAFFFALLYRFLQYGLAEVIEVSVCTHLICVFYVFGCSFRVLDLW